MVLQHNRTPVAREWARFRDELMSAMMAEVSLGNEETFHRRARALRSEMTYEQWESLRLEMLEDLQSGRVKLASTPSREVGFVFMACDVVAERLVQDFRWTVVHAPEKAEFVLPGMGITLYDPTPPHPYSGFGFASSPNSQTIVPVDPNHALALTPGKPVWCAADASAEDVEEINLRSYAWSDAAFYGNSQRVVTDLRALARRERARVGRFKPRPGRLWIAEGGSAGNPPTGEIEFTGYAPRGDVVTQTFNIDPRAYEHSEPFRG